MTPAALRFPFLSVLAASLLLGQPVAAEQLTPLDQRPAPVSALAAVKVAQAAPASDAASPAAPPAPVTAPPLRPGEVLLNFQGADIQAVVKTISQMTGRNFLLDPRVKGEITIISARPVSTNSAYQIFLAALKAQGFTAVEGPGALTKIVPSADAKLNAEVSSGDGAPRQDERMITHVVVMQHASASQLIPLLRPLIAPTSQISAFEPSNALIITDYADNIRRLVRLLEKLDQPLGSEVTIVPLRHASAQDLAELLVRLTAHAAPPTAQPGVPPQTGGGDRFVIIPDLRTNSLLIRTDNTGRLAQLRMLIGKLDVPAIQSGNTRVIYLKNAEALRLAEVLRGLLAGEAVATPGRPGAAPAAAAAAAIRPASPGEAAVASLIQADEATNSLIISAPDAIYNNLRGVIEKLDVRRAQVFVEALIVEITGDRATEFGVQWAGVTPVGSGAVGALSAFPFTGSGLVTAATNPIETFATSGGLSIGFIGREITLPDGSTVRGLGALARALEQNNIANILSTPNLMTLDNAEATIVVGQNVPFLTGSYAQATGTTGAAVNPFQTIERKDVGITLKIKPQISDGGVIRLDIYQEVSSIARSILAASDLITNKRSLETKVIVDDGHTIVLGGLIEDNKQSSEQSVPFLGRIPLIGWLFRYRSNDSLKTNLMIFLRPTILHTAQDGYSMTSDRYDYLRGLDPQPSATKRALLDRLAPTPPDEPPVPPMQAPPAPAATGPTPADGAAGSSAVPTAAGPPPVPAGTDAPAPQPEVPPVPLTPPPPAPAAAAPAAPEPTPGEGAAGSGAVPADAGPPPVPAGTNAPASQTDF